MDHRFYLSEVYGPHITSSPNHRVAAEWAANAFNLTVFRTFA